MWGCTFLRRTYIEGLFPLLSKELFLICYLYLNIFLFVFQSIVLLQGMQMYHTNTHAYETYFLSLHAHRSKVIARNVKTSENKSEVS